MKNLKIFYLFFSLLNYELKKEIFVNDSVLFIYLFLLSIFKAMELKDKLYSWDKIFQAKTPV